LEPLSSRVWALVVLLSDMSFPLDPEPSVLWTLIRGDEVAACLVRFVPTGVEMLVLRNEKRLFSRVFKQGDDALTAAAVEERRMIADGWQEPPG
jgi:hypothetical protein